MNSKKSFVAPEWDADVPGEFHLNNLAKKAKLKKSIKPKTDMKKGINNNIRNKLENPLKENNVASKLTVSQKPENIALKTLEPKIKRKFDDFEDLKSKSLVAVIQKGKPIKNKKRKLSHTAPQINKSGNHKITSGISKLASAVEDTKSKPDAIIPSKIPDTSKKRTSDTAQGITKNAKKKLMKPKPSITNKDSKPPTPLSKTEKNRKRRRKKRNIISAPPDAPPTTPKLFRASSSNANFSKKISALLSGQTESQNNEPNLPEPLPENIKDISISTKKVEKVSTLNKTLRQRMMEKLKSARFRYLNEQMYKKESKDAKQMFADDPTAFGAYHTGYRQQVSKWPLNPLNIIIKDISQLPKEYTVADLGCGDGRLAKSVPQTVHSFDLVSLDPSIQACDMAHTPLLTSQVNVVVFCLALMGTNLMDYIIEANRILKVGGFMKIAEVESRFENIDEFIKDIQKYGFNLLKSDLNQNLFYFIDFQKQSEIKKRNKLPQLTLKPCLYKKR